MCDFLCQIILQDCLGNDHKASQILKWLIKREMEAGSYQKLPYAFTNSFLWAEVLITYLKTIL